MRFEVPADLAGERADRVLAVLASLSRSAARALVEGGIATVDGSAVEPSAKVAAGAVIEFELPEPPAPLSAEPIPFTVLYEDRHLAVIDKPAGVVVHPGAGRRTGTLAGGLLERWPQVRGVGDEDRWGIVHRLDRDTSGAMVVALDHEAFAGLRDLVGRRAIVRRYLALVHGCPPAPTGTIDAPLGRDPRRPRRVAVVLGGRPARTHYRVVAGWAGLTLLEMTLETGRTHQIRVHLQEIDLPVYGDGMYGRPHPGSRVFLHAAHLGFDHPMTGARVEASAPLPADLAGVLDGLGAPSIGALP